MWIVFECRFQIAQGTIIVLVTQIEFGTLHVGIAGAAVSTGNKKRGNNEAQKERKSVHDIQIG